ncbi:MAG: hypothetical protein WCN27_02655 [Alphaproteobacteria bacterium]
MRGLSKVAILSVAVIAIGGQLFAPRIRSDEDIQKDQFIERSKAVIGRDWTGEESYQFQTTYIIPEAIKSRLTTAQIDEFFGGQDTIVGKKYREALEKLAAK